MNIHEKIKNDSKQGGSSAGYSFYKSFLTCPRKFALEELLGVNTRSVKWALVQGTVVHGALEALYQGYSQQDIDTYIDQLCTLLLEHDDQRELLRMRVKLFVEKVRTTYLEDDIKDYTNFQFEVPIGIPLYGGFRMTGRIDKLYQNARTGTWIIGDYKTTGQGISTAVRQAEQGDQFTLYTWGMKEKYPENRYQTVVDVLYGRDLKSTGFTVNLSRGIPMIYTHEQMLISVLGFTEVVLQVSQKVKSYLSGEAPLEFLFPRNGTICGIFGCPYSDICRTQINPKVLEREDFTFDRQKVDNMADFSQFEINFKEK